MNTTIFSAHHFDLSPEELEKFEKFLTVFIEYNSHTNLSAIRDEEGIIEKHFADSLYGASIIGELLPCHREGGSDPVFGKQSIDCHVNSSQKQKNLLAMTGPRLLDIGSGGGFPGIPLKIVIPELQVTLLDSVGKKVKAMNHFVSELGLDGIHAIQERAEILAKDKEHKEKYDFVVSRATAYITDILFWARPFLTKGGKIILYKMPSDEERKDREKVLKKLGLILEGELIYEVGEKKRVIYVIGQK